MKKVFIIAAALMICAWSFDTSIPPGIKIGPFDLAEEKPDGLIDMIQISHDEQPPTITVYDGGKVVFEGKTVKCFGFTLQSYKECMGEK